MPEISKLVEAFLLGMLGALAVDLGVNNTIERIHRARNRRLIKMGTLGRVLGGGIVALAAVGQEIPTSLFVAACLVLGATGGAALLSVANRRKVEETKTLSLEKISSLTSRIDRAITEPASRLSLHTPAAVAREVGLDGDEEQRIERFVEKREADSTLPALSLRPAGGDGASYCVLSEAQLREIAEAAREALDEIRAS